jgi:hypothetical protein
MGWSSQAVIAQQVVIEGSADGLWVYNGAPAAGNLLLSIAAAAGTDPYGNTYPQGLNLNGPEATYLLLQATGSAAALAIQPPQESGHTWEPGSLSGTLAEFQELTYPAVQLTAPQESGASESPPFIQLLGSLVGGIGTVVTVQADQVEISATSVGTSQTVAVEGFLTCDEIIPNNMAWGTAQITVSSAGSPASASVSFGPLAGSAVACLVTAETAFPGSHVTGVGYMGLSTRGVTLWLDASVTGTFTVSYLVISQ